MADVNIPISITPQMSGLENVLRRVTEVKRELADLADWDVLPGGGIRRKGYVDRVVVPPRLPGAEPPESPQRRMRPPPPDLIASPFGPAAGGPPGLPRPPRPGSPAWLAAQGYTVVPPGTPPGGGGGPPPGPAGPWQGPGGNQGGGWQWSRGGMGYWMQQSGAGQMLSQAGGAIGGAMSGAGQWAAGQGGQMLQSAQGIARGVLSIGAGVGIYQTLTESMRVYQEQARGVLDVGARLNQSFDGAHDFLTRLSTGYRMLTHESVAGLQAMSRYNVDLTGTDEAALYAQGYRVPFTQAAAMEGQLSKRTIGAHPMAALLGTLGTSQGGMPAIQTRMEEAVGVAGAGGLSMPTMTPEFSARLTNLIQGMGTRYQEPGAATAMAGQVLGGLNQAPNDFVQGIRMRAIGTLAQQKRARGQSTTIDIGGMPVDIGTMWGQQVAADAAAGSKDVTGAYEAEAQRMAGGHPELLRAIQSQVVLGGARPYQTEQFYRSPGMPATGLAGLGAAAPGATAQAGKTMAERMESLQDRAEFGPEKIAAMWEQTLLPMGRSMVEMSNNMREAIAKVIESAKDGIPTWEGLKEGFLGMNNTAKILLGTLTMLSATNMPTFAFGGVLTAAGVAGAAPPGTYTGTPWGNTPGPSIRLRVPGMEAFQDNPLLGPTQLGP